MPNRKRKLIPMPMKGLHGGRRPGAGRPRVEQKVRCSVPESLVAEVTQYIENRGLRLPMYSSRVPAGSPTEPAEGMERIDLRHLLMADPDDTYLLQVSGDSMIKAGIDDGDFLVVKKKAEVTNGKIVVAMVDGQVTVKRFKKEKSGAVVLEPENDAYKPIKITEGQSLDISGVVSRVIKKV